RVQVIELAQRIADLGRRLVLPTLGTPTIVNIVNIGGTGLRSAGGQGLAEGAQPVDEAGRSGTPRSVNIVNIGPRRGRFSPLPGGGAVYSRLLVVRLRRSRCGAGPARRPRFAVGGAPGRRVCGLSRLRAVYRRPIAVVHRRSRSGRPVGA